MLLADTLRRMMAGEHLPEEPIRIAPDAIITRRSTDVFVVPHLKLKKALNFFQENAFSNIGVADGAAAAGLSTSMLNRLFRRYLHQSALDYLRELRLEDGSVIRLASAHMKEANEELLDVESAVSQYEESDEEGLEQLSKELDIPAKGRPKAGWKGLSRSSLPFECFIGNTRLLFGKSSKENDCLTFLFARGRKLHWFHIQGDSGSHLVLKSENPSAEEIEIAAEIAVLLKGREDGDVIHALRGDVRKGSAPGQAVLKKFEVIRVNGIGPAAKEALAGARKAERP